MKPDEARSALDGVDRVEARLGSRARWPLWRHGLVGVVAGLLVAASASSGWVSVTLYASLLAMTLAVVWLDRRQFGMFVSGYRGTRPRWAVAASVLVIGASLFATFYLDLQPSFDPLFVGIVLGAIAGSTLTSLWWERLYRAELDPKGQA